mgnify:CR=1 FL=1
MHEFPHRPRHKAVRPGRRQRHSLYAVAAVLMVSGLVWLVAHYALPLPDDAARHPAEPWAMRIHGAATLLGMAVLGALWSQHVVPAWRAGERRATGLPLLAAWLLLALSGYGLYYLADEAWRDAADALHVGAGLALPLTLAGHVWLQGGRRKKGGRSSGPSPLSPQCKETG